MAESNLRGIKLNLGASTIWEKEGWHVLDHKLEKTDGHRIAGNALKIDLPDESCEVVFCSHVVEHIPHVQLPLVFAEVNRILAPGGLLRILTPDLERIAKAYVEKDSAFFAEAKLEDESIRIDLGFGGMFVNFVVSPGQDTALFSRDLREFVAGYAHLYSYDFEMLRILLTQVGFSVKKSGFCASSRTELREPLHVSGLAPVWQNLNQSFYESHGLVHRLVDGKYEINFKTTGFDRDPLTSLIVEGTKLRSVSASDADLTFNHSSLNYNRYSESLLRDGGFVERLEEFQVTPWRNSLLDNL